MGGATKNSDQTGGDLRFILNSEAGSRRMIIRRESRDQIVCHREKARMPQDLTLYRKFHGQLCTGLQGL